MGISKAQFAEQIKILLTVYPNQRFIPNNEAMDIWYGFLCNLSYDSLVYAVKEYIPNHQYPPTIYELKRIAETVEKEHKRNVEFQNREFSRSIQFIDSGESEMQCREMFLEMIKKVSCLRFSDYCWRKAEEAEANGKPYPTYKELTEGFVNERS